MGCWVSSPLSLFASWLMSSLPYSAAVLPQAQNHEAHQRWSSLLSHIVTKAADAPRHLLSLCYTTCCPSWGSYGLLPNTDSMASFLPSFLEFLLMSCWFFHWSIWKKALELLMYHFLHCSVSFSLLINCGATWESSSAVENMLSICKVPRSVPSIMREGREAEV